MSYTDIFYDMSSEWK